MARTRWPRICAGQGLTRERVLALALHLLDLGYFRAGGEQYAEENESYGLATLLCEHVTVRAVTPWHSTIPPRAGCGGPSRSRIPRSCARCGRCCAGARPHRAIPGVPQRIRLADVHADDLNARFKELVGDDYSVKDLRTWHGTVLAAEAFVDADPPVSKAGDQAGRVRVMKEVAEELGNTPAVARGSYVDPRVVAGYESELTIAAAVEAGGSLPGHPG